MKCPNCNNEIDENQQFCSHCGKKLNGKENVWFKENAHTLFVIGFLIVICFVFGLYNRNSILKDKAPLEITKSFDNVGRVELSVKYDTVNKKVLLSVLCKEIVAEDWMQEYLTYFYKKHPNTEPANLTIKENKQSEPLDIKCEGIKIINGQNLVINFVIYDVDTKEFAGIKEIITNAQNSDEIHFNKLKVFDSNEQIRLKEKNKWLTEKKQIALDEKAIEIAQQWAFVSMDNENESPVNFNPRKCFFKVKGICFGRPFIARGMSYEECKANRGFLGINHCGKSDDLFATTALVCGGVQNIPTLDELIILAKDLYDDTNIGNIKDADGCIGGHGYAGVINYGTCNANGHKRNNNKDYLEYFREIYWDNTNFKDADEEQDRINMDFGIISAVEFEGSYVDAMYGRIFSKNFTSLGYIERYGKISLSDNPSYERLKRLPVASICVDRNNSISIKSKYPIGIAPKKEPEKPITTKEGFDEWVKEMKQRNH